ncbi:hypothetical protein [Stenotrophomonas sp. SORGH_AS_0321]|uniref:hypothetical protein n=1 Tax=Stenotrophomonas sp. SORGH_AS_0321 TaxID=3041787 RepID=UPI00285612C4|nr:hypothetical protein [Stenotrophomonas sp. SORGH_AS_0321]MDR6093319.1 hypothetical protein [Stenotrophomonas sp. SORGH_AS_0321]
MPGEIIGEGLAALLRWLLQQLAWFVVEIVLGGTGYLILRLLRSRRAEDGDACVLAGLVFWVATGFSVGWWLRRSTG